MRTRTPVRYELVLPPGMIHQLRSHLLADRTREQMAVLLSGIARGRDRTRLLGRHLITLPPGAFAEQSASSLVLDQDVQRDILRLAAREGLSQIDFHTHPGEGARVAFSYTDDENERRLATYLAERMPGTVYGSVVINGRSHAARIWEVVEGQPVSAPLALPGLDDAAVPWSSDSPDRRGIPDGRFDRQVRAFGADFQRRLGSLSVGVVGCGGLGSVLIEQLARLGVRKWVLVDPDRVEVSNLNRLLGATVRDADDEVAKVGIARRNIRRIDPQARVRALRSTVYAPRALAALKGCDLVIAATDNDASRLAVNALACQYLIPLVHVGVNLARRDDGFEDISGEVAIPSLGDWCLLCSGIINAQRAAWDLARPEEQALLTARGYIEGTPAPAVYHLNALIASLAATEIHNLVRPYKPLRRYLIYNELQGELLAVGVPTQEACLHCGTQGRLALGDLVSPWRPDPPRSVAAILVPEAGPVEDDAEAADGHADNTEMAAERPQ